MKKLSILGALAAITVVMFVGSCGRSGHENGAFVPGFPAVIDGISDEDSPIWGDDLAGNPH